LSESVNSCSDRKRLAMTQLQRTLGRMQEIGDQKLALVAEIIERVEIKTRQLEQNVENLGTIIMFDISCSFARITDYSNSRMHVMCEIGCT
jgi:Inhibitor of growth proteins N-terminal histone-binding